MRGLPSVLVPVEIDELDATINWPPPPIEYGLRVLSPAFNEYTHEPDTFTIIGLYPHREVGEDAFRQASSTADSSTSESRPVLGSAAKTVISPVPVAFGGNDSSSPQCWWDQAGREHIRSLPLASIVAQMGIVPELL